VLLNRAPQRCIEIECESIVIDWFILGLRRLFQVSGGSVPEGLPAMRTVYGQRGPLTGDATGLLVRRIASDMSGEGGDAAGWRLR
jgi:flavin-dependent dehydrogenase